MNNPRTISQIIEPQVTIEGAGVRLLRSFGPKVSNLFDPFLLFDHFAFNDPLEGPMRGFPYHPHRGIETVTYMLEGSTAHRDSLGNEGTIGPGDVQWMSSGRGILHEEMPRRGESGNIYGFQLWVNLPSHLKMSEPRYQEVNTSTIPTFEKDGIRIRVVAGTVDGVSGPVEDISASPLWLRHPSGIFPSPADIPPSRTFSMVKESLPMKPSARRRCSNFQRMAITSKSKPRTTLSASCSSLARHSKNPSCHTGPS